MKKQIYCFQDDQKRIELLGSFLLNQINLKARVTKQTNEQTTKIIFSVTSELKNIVRNYWKFELASFQFDLIQYDGNLCGFFSFSQHKVKREMKLSTSLLDEQFQPSNKSLKYCKFHCTTQKSTLTYNDQKCNRISISMSQIQVQ